MKAFDEVDLNLRFWCFSVSQYYPCGGLKDIYFTTNYVDKAIAWARQERNDYVSVFDAVDRVYVDWEVEA